MLASIAANLRDLPRALTLPALLSGLLVIVVGSASSLVIVFQAASAAQLDADHTSSWVVALMLGCAFSCIVMSLWFRQPVIAAWSTPGVVLLVDSFKVALAAPGYNYGDYVGAFAVASLAIILLGASGLFGWVMARVPTSVVMGMLAGVLIRFGFGLFNAIPEDAALVLAMIAVFYLLRRLEFRAPTVGALVVGIVVAALGNTIHLESLNIALATPVYTPPSLTLQTLLGVALPLAALALTAQNAPGQAVLKNAGYNLPINGALVVTGLASLLGAPFGGHGITLAAITATLVTGPESHPDKDLRYGAGVATGLWYLLLGIFGATLVSVFTALPHPLIAAIAGLGLLGALSSSLAASMSDPQSRDGGLIALLCTAANFTLLGIGAPFWGLVFGVAVEWVLRWRKKN